MTEMRLDNRQLAGLRDLVDSPQGLSPHIKLIIEALARDVAARENREAAVDDESKAA